MKYRIELVPRNQPENLLQFDITAIRPDKERYKDNHASLFDDYGLTKVLAKLRKEFLIHHVRCLDINPFGNTASEKSKLCWRCGQFQNQK